MYILKRYSEFEELHDTQKRNLPVSPYFFLIPRLTTIPNVAFSPPITPYPTSKGSSCALWSCISGWPSQGTPILACKRFVPSWTGWKRLHGLGYYDISRKFNSNYDILSKLSLWSPGVSQLVDEQNILSSKDTQYLCFTGSMLSSEIIVELRVKLCLGLLF